MNKTIAEHTSDVLRETNKRVLAYNDTELLTEIAIRSGLRFCPPQERRKKVLVALGKSKWFTKDLVRNAGGRVVRRFTEKKSLEEKVAALADPFAAKG